MIILSFERDYKKAKTDCTQNAFNFTFTLTPTFYQMDAYQQFKTLLENYEKSMDKIATLEAELDKAHKRIKQLEEIVTMATKATRLNLDILEGALGEPQPAAVNPIASESGQGQHSKYLDVNDVIHARITAVTGSERVPLLLPAFTSVELTTTAGLVLERRLQARSSRSGFSLLTLENVSFSDGAPETLKQQVQELLHKQLTETQVKELFMPTLTHPRTVLSSIYVSAINGSESEAVRIKSATRELGANFGNGDVQAFVRTLFVDCSWESKKRARSPSSEVSDNDEQTEKQERTALGDLLELDDILTLNISTMTSITLEDGEKEKQSVLRTDHFKQLELSTTPRLVIERNNLTSLALKGSKPLAKITSIEYQPTIPEAIKTELEAKRTSGTLLTGDEIEKYFMRNMPASDTVVTCLSVIGVGGSSSEFARIKATVRAAGVRLRNDKLQTVVRTLFAGRGYNVRL